MGCGLEAEIIAYRNNKSIDVRLSDGTVKLNRMYKEFSKGQIGQRSTSLITRIGEKNIMHCGMEAEIIAYHSSSDIDVKFEDGTIVCNKRYDSFMRKKINNPSLSIEEYNPRTRMREVKDRNNKKIQNERIGEKKVMNCGMMAEIIAYRTSKDVDIRFEDETIIQHTLYRHFINGNIRNPNINISVYRKPRSSSKINRPKKELNTKGKIRIGNSNNQIKNPSLKPNPQKPIQKPIKTKQVKIPKEKINYKEQVKEQYRNKRIGEKRIMNCGMEAEIIAYRTCDDLDVRFTDGYIKVHAKYQQFCRGKIYNPEAFGYPYCSRNEFFLLFVLEKYGFFKSERGELKDRGLGNMELDLYNPDFHGHEIAIEYDGGLVLNGNGHTVEKDKKKDQRCSKAGIELIRDREPQLTDYVYSARFIHLSDSAILSKDLLRATNELIDYLNKTYNAFIPSVKEINRKAVIEAYQNKYGVEKNSYKKMVRNFSNTPSIHHYKKEQSYQQAQERLTEVKTMNCGMDAMIIAYRNSKDIDVEFDDGYVAKNRRYKEFKNGTILNKNLNKLSK